MEFLLFAYLLYVLSTSLYKSYQIDRFIQKTEEENAALERANSRLIEDYEYYSSDAYKEKIAKQNFGLVRPGEKVIILSPENAAFRTSEEEVVATNKAYYYSLSNPRKWFMFFFDRDRFSF